MKASHKALSFFIFSGLVFLLLTGAGHVPVAEGQQGIQVTAADPPAAAQGTVSLNVTVSGTGFKRGAQAKWFVTGTTNPGGVTVNSTAFVNSSQLVANITVADTAVLGGFDIQVQNSDGRTGKGIELFSVNQKTGPAPDPAITYTAALSGQMYVMNDDGSNQTLVHGGSNAMPSWSPDGSQLVFASDSRKGKGVYIINKDGSGTCKLATVNGGSAWPYIGPVWSPLPMGDGKFKVVYADVPIGGTNPDLFVVNADCTNPGTPMNITNTPNVTEWFPSWSRFANRIAAQVDFGVVVYDVNVVNGVVQVTSQTALSTLGLFPPNSDPTVVRYVCEPDFGKTDDRLAVESNLNVNFDYPQIWITDLTTANTYNLTQGKVAFADNPTWSPDGLEIVFRERETLHGTPIGLFKMNLATGAITQLTGFSAVDIKGYYPDWRRCFRACPPDKPGCQLCK